MGCWMMGMGAGVVVAAVLLESLGVAAAAPATSASPASSVSPASSRPTPAPAPATESGSASTAAMPGQATGTVEAIDPRAADAERRMRIQGLLAVAGLVGLVAAYLAWRRIRALTPRAVVLAIEGLPAEAAAGDTLRPRIVVTARAPLEHQGLRVSLVYRLHPGPRARKTRFEEREAATQPLAPDGALGAGESREVTGELTLPADAAPTYDHAFGVDLPPGREAISHWVVRAALRIGDAEVQAEQLVAVAATPR